MSKFYYCLNYSGQRADPENAMYIQLLCVMEVYNGNNVFVFVQEVTDTYDNDVDPHSTDKSLCFLVCHFAVELAGNV